MGVGDGVAVRALRQRGARQERLHEGPAALPLQGVRAQLHRHATPGHAAAGQGHGRAALPERAVDEPHRQAARGLDPQRDDLDRAVRQSLRAKTRARGPRSGDRSRRDMWHFLKKKANKLWIWKARDRASGRVVDWECGGRDAATLRRLLDRVERWKPRLYCTDDWAAYAELIPQGRLYVGKDQTHGIERDHSRQRHWLARFRRRTCVVSKAVHMVEASIALFVRFGDLGGVNELLSMLA